jgi:hypothetical protein
MQVRLFRSVPYLLLAASVVLSGIVTLAPAPNRPVAAFFPPWWSAERSFVAAAAAGGAIIRFGGIPSVLVLASGTPDLTGRLRLAGAWLLLDARAIGACGAEIRKVSPS